MSFEVGIGDLQTKSRSILPSEASAPVQSKQLNAAAEVRGPSAPGVDQTSLSPMGGIISQAMSGSDVRTEKVAALQQAISSGQYNVPSSEVANKMLQSLLE